VRVIGVVDLDGGRAVHASGGDRKRYAPVERVGASAIEPGDAVALARAYTGPLGLSELYVADLDAIAGGPFQAARIAALTSLNAPTWVDAGVAAVERARRLIDLGAAQVIVGLETLPSFGALAAICSAVGGRRVAFSLDLRDGRPLTADSCSGPREDPAALAARAADAGAGSVIVIDLARVGGEAGLDLRLVGDVRAAVPQLTLVVGGGVRGAEDLTRLADAGCDAALVATALHDGRIGAAEIRRAALSGPPTRG
jgi:phosphoribosylformimino-5-aminoimidazole carboxamide ribotide isomerase